MADSLVVIDPRGKILMANRATHALLEYDEGSLVGEPIQRITAGAEGSSTTEPLPLRAHSYQTESEYIASDGRRIPVLVSTTAMRSEGNHLICLAQDLRERKRAEGELRVAKEKAEDASRAKSAFLANMSHEIRTPLNAVLGYTQLMLRDPALEKLAKDYLNIISRSGEHLLALINDVLDMSKIEAGGMTANVQPFDVAQLVADLAAMFKLRASSKGLRFDVVEAHDVVRTVLGDQGKIRQVLINLVANAIKFTDRGHVKLEVTVSGRPNGQLWLSARVEDTGVGIAASEQGKLFQPFTQTQSGIRLQAGTGLGLAISAQYARLMGGRITLTSEVGTGTVCLFEIPVQAVDEASAIRVAPNYLYADQAPGPDEAPGPDDQELTSIDGSVRALKAEALDTLPVEWADDMRRAIFNGDKDRVNELIAHIPQRDAEFARALQRLADRYEYDALTELLDRA
jgi:PAS domain S-box-containing protein